MSLLDLAGATSTQSSGDGYMYLNFAGIDSGSPAPSAIWPIYGGGIGLSLFDNVPIQSISILGPDNIVVYSQSPNATTFTDTIYTSSTPGHYVLTATDANGTTVAPFDFSNIQVVSPYTATCSPELAASDSALASFTVIADAGVSYYESINVDGTSNGVTPVCSGSGCPQSFFVPPTVGYAWNIGDAAGNEIGVFPSGCTDLSSWAPRFATRALG